MAVTISTHTLTKEGNSNVELNQSQVRYLVQLTTSGQSHNDNNLTTTYYIDGVQYTKTHKLPLNSTTTVVDKTVTITHNADGSRTVNASFSTPTRISAGTVTGSQTLILDPIPRASTFTISKTSGGEEATSFTLGETLYVNITRASSSFTHKVYWKVGTSANQSISNNAGTSANTTLAINMSNYIPSTSATATIYVDTYNGNNLIGSKSQTFTVNVPSTVVPTISSVTKTDTTGYYSTYNAYVQGKSNLRIQTTASGIYGSSINSSAYVVKLKKNSNNAVIETKTGSDVTFSNISYTGTIKVEVTVTDSRNRTATDTSTITVASYSNPNISYLTAERDSTTPSTVKLTFNATIKNINSSGVNSKTFTLKKRQKGTSTWTTLETYSSGYSYSNSNYTTTCDENYSWEFQLDATDSFTSASFLTDISTVFELINYGSNGTSIGFGKIAEGDYTFDVDLTTTFMKNVQFEESANMGLLEIESLKSKNMAGSWYVGGINSDTGVDSDSTASRRTDYIPVDFTNVSRYRLSGMPAVNGSIFVNAYNSNKQSLGRTGAAVHSSTTALSLSNTVFTNGTPQSTGEIKYVRICMYGAIDNVNIDDLTKNVQLEEGNTTTTFTEYKNYGYVGGSNANGNYIKYDDGTLIQWGETTATTGTTSRNRGGITVYYSDSVTQNFPISFIDNTCNVHPQINGGTGAVNFIYTVMYRDRVGITLESTASSYSRTIRWIAIGRWK